MAVIDFATGEKLLSLSLDNPQDFTYRCVYYEWGTQLRVPHLACLGGNCGYASVARCSFTASSPSKSCSPSYR